MRSFLLLAWLTLWASQIAGQYVPVNSAGNHIIQLFPDSGYQVINGQHTLKTITTNHYVNSNPLSFDKYSDNNQPRIIYKNESPVYIERTVSPLKTATSLSPEERFYTFLEETSPITNIKTPKGKFAIRDIHTDDLGITHIRAVQQHKGIDIYGSESVLHIDQEKERFTGSIAQLDTNTVTEPLKGTTEVLQVVRNNLAKETVYRELTDAEKELLHYEAPLCSLVYYNHKNKGYELTWEITIRPNLIEEWKYFVDAVTGKIIHWYNNTKSDGPMIGTGEDLNNQMRTFDVYLAGGIYYMYNITESMFNPVTNEGIIITLDANNTPANDLDYTYVTSTDNTWTQRAAISAHCNAAKTYEYFDTTFNRRSINGLGGNIISLVNVTSADGSSLENAFWNGQAVFYGNGGDKLKPLAGGLDVTAHELGHGVVSATANLEYYGQSGAINESFADIFACMVDRFDWKIGEDITKPDYSPSGAIRDMSDPHNMGDSTKPYWQPAHMSEIYLGEENNGGVHKNSGIVNYAYYLFASQVGKPKAEKVYYRALTEYLTKTSGFVDLRVAVIQSARDLFGDGSIEMAHASNAFEAVGIYDEEPVDNNRKFDPNPGEQFLLSYDTNPSDPVSLYLSSAEGTNYQPLTETPMKGKVSVTDNGETAVFVSNDHRLRMININPGNTGECIISGFSFYKNVAISKDGKRLAATRGIADASIYVIDLVTGEGRQFVLYNPTTSHSGVTSGGVIKADAVEFDVTGEYVIYDAYNVLNSNSLKDIYYWDIGIIKVWDNDMQAFGDGSITKVFNSLPANVNITNPVFSRTDPSIIAFDYFYDDGILEEYAVYMADINKGMMNRIITNDRLGYPSFSVNDDRIAYSTVNGLNMQVIKSIMLEDDKMTPKGEPGVLVPDAKWPVYFATGIRPLGLVPVTNFTVDYRYGNFPLSVRFIDLSSNKPFSWQWTFPGGNPASSTEQNPRVIYENPGIYEITLSTMNQYGGNTLTKSNYIIVIDPTSTSHDVHQSFRIYPNPSNRILTIEGEGDFSVRIFNLQGKMLMSVQHASQIDVSSLANGIYVLELETPEGISHHKFLKQD